MNVGQILEKHHKDDMKIIGEWLKTNGYTGLYDEDGECGCHIDELFPCGEIYPHCKVGYKAQCDESCEHERSGNDDWHIQAEQPNNGKVQGVRE